VPKLLVGVPLYAGMDNPCLAPLVNMLLYTARVRPDISIEIETTDRVIVWLARDTLRRKAIRGHFDWLFFVGEDILVEQTTLFQLLELNLPIVSALYFSRHFPYSPLFLYKADDGRYRNQEQDLSQPLIKVDATGLDCTLVHRSVLEKVGDKCFEPVSGMPGEDQVFFEYVRQAGFQPVVATNIKVGHLSSERIVIDQEVSVETKHRLRDYATLRMDKSGPDRLRSRGGAGFTPRITI